ncbi:MAG TPA: hypothetical protein VJX66_31935 [Amycolatopsis sp.]|nr:hypothetical protein [Amycolatopsis sp.]
MTDSTPATAARREVGDRVHFHWMLRERTGTVAEVRHSGRRTWLWIEFEHDGQRLRMAYEPHEVTDA